MAAPRLFVIMMENLGCSQVVTNAYVQSLIASGAAALGYSGVTNPSLPNYLALGSGAWDYDTDGDTPTGPFVSDNLFAQLTAAGISWGAYIDGYPGTLPLPASGSTIDYATLTSNGYGFAGHHFGGFFWDSFVNVPGQMELLQGWSALQTLLSGPASGVPQLSWITPTLSNQKTAGGMQTYVEAIQASAAWAEGGVLIVTWDNQPIADSPAYLPTFVQAPDTDDTGGNVLAVVLASTARPQPRIIPGTQWNRTLSHYSLLAAIETAYGLPLLGYAADGPTWAELTDLIRGGRAPAASQGAGARKSPGAYTYDSVTTTSNVFFFAPDTTWRNQRIVTTVTASTAETQTFVRALDAGATGNFYWADLRSDAVILKRRVDGVAATLASGAGTPAMPFTVEMSAVGDLIAVTINGTAWVSASDASLATGAPGVGCYSAGGGTTTFSPVTALPW